MRAGALLGKQAERVEVVQPEDEKAPGRQGCGLSVLKGGSKEGCVHTF